MKLVQVQVLRALAALAVATGHAQHDAGALAARFGRAFEPVGAFPWNAGVDLFFVISGLIMVHSSEPLFGRPGSPSLFLRRRTARIVPAYWGATTLYLGVALLAPTFLNRAFLDPWFVLASYLFVPVERPDGLVQPVYGLGWTLNYEMAFYGLFAVALVLPRRAAAGALIAALAALAVAGRLLAPLPQPLAFWTDPIILEFGFGVGLGLARAEGLWATGPVRIALAAAGFVGLVLAAGDAALAWPRPLVYGAPAALIIAGAALAPHDARPQGRLARWGVAVGDASYALYLLHPFAIRATREVFWQTGLARLGPWTFVAAALAASALLALVAYRAVERPLTRAVRRLLRAETVGAGSDAVVGTRAALPR